MRFAVLLASVVGCLAMAGSTAVSRADDVDTCLKGTGDETLAACTRAIDSGRLEGNDLAVAYLNRGIAYKDKGDRGRAISDLDEAIRLNPSSADAYRTRGIAYRGH